MSSTVAYPQEAILDSTVIGRGILSAADELAVRTLIGVGTADSPAFGAVNIGGGTLGSNLLKVHGSTFDFYVNNTGVVYGSAFYTPSDNINLNENGLSCSQSAVASGLFFRRTTYAAADARITSPAADTVLVSDGNGGNTRKTSLSVLGSLITNGIALRGDIDFVELLKSDLSGYRDLYLRDTFGRNLTYTGTLSVGGGYFTVDAFGTTVAGGSIKANFPGNPTGWTRLGHTGSTSYLDNGAGDIVITPAGGTVSVAGLIATTSRGSSSAPALQIGPSAEKLGLWSQGPYYLNIGVNGNAHIQLDSAYGTHFPLGPVDFSGNVTAGVSGTGVSTILYSSFGSLRYLINTGSNSNNLAFYNNSGDQSLVFEGNNALNTSQIYTLTSSLNFQAGALAIPNGSGAITSNRPFTSSGAISGSYFDASDTSAFRINTLTAISNSWPALRLNPAGSWTGGVEVVGPLAGGSLITSTAAAGNGYVGFKIVGAGKAGGSDPSIGISFINAYTAAGNRQLWIGASNASANDAGLRLVFASGVFQMDATEFLNPGLTKDFSIGNASKNVAFPGTITVGQGATFNGNSYPASYISVVPNSYGFHSGSAGPALKFTDYSGTLTFGISVDNAGSFIIGNAAQTAGMSITNSVLNHYTRIQPITNNSKTNGDASFRWSNVYSVLGDFSSTLTVGNLVANGVGTGTVTAAGFITSGSTGYLQLSNRSGAGSHFTGYVDAGVMGWYSNSAGLTRWTLDSSGNTVQSGRITSGATGMSLDNASNYGILDSGAAGPNGIVFKVNGAQQGYWTNAGLLVLDNSGITAAGRFETTMVGTSNSQGKFRALEFQSYSVDSNFIGSNVYHNGANWMRRATGNAAVWQALNGETLIYGDTYAAAGSYTPNIRAKVGRAGAFAIGGVISATDNTFTGGTIIGDASQNVTMAGNLTIPSTGILTAGLCTVYGTSGYGCFDSGANGNGLLLRAAGTSVLGTQNVGFGGTVYVNNLTANGRIESLVAGTSNSQIKGGSIELQSYGVNNSWISDNIYHDGTGFRYRSAGSGCLTYYNGGDWIHLTAPTGSAAAAVTYTARLKLTNASGAFAIGGAISQVTNTFTGGTIIGDASQNVTMAGTLELPSTTPGSPVLKFGTGGAGLDGGSGILRLWAQNTLIGYSDASGTVFAKPTTFSGNAAIGGMAINGSFPGLGVGGGSGNYYITCTNTGTGAGVRMFAGGSAGITGIGDLSLYVNNAALMCASFSSTDARFTLGNVGSAVGGASGTIRQITGLAAFPILRIEGDASQSGDFIRCVDSPGTTTKFAVSSAGSLMTAGDIQLGGASGLRFKSSGGVLMARNAADSAYATLIAGDLAATSAFNVGASGDLAIKRSAASKMILDNYAGTAGVLFDVSTDGTLKLRNRADSANGALTCGTINAVGITSTSDIYASGAYLLTNAAVLCLGSAYVDSTNYQGGGGNSSYPSMRRNGAAWAFRKADNLSDCDISTAAITASGQVLASISGGANSGFRTGSAELQGLFGATTGTLFGNNLYFDGTNWRYRATGFASGLVQANDGTLNFYSDASMSAGTSLTPTLRFKVDAAGAASGTSFSALDFYGGGTTSSYPRWKRNGSGWSARFADDSNWCTVSCGGLVTHGSVGLFANNNTTTLQVNNNSIQLAAGGFSGTSIIDCATTYIDVYGPMNFQDSDLSFIDTTKGPILIDRTSGLPRRLVCTGGVLSTEAV